MWAAVTGQLPHVLGPSFDFGWAFDNPDDVPQDRRRRPVVLLCSCSGSRSRSGIPAAPRAGLLDPPRASALPGAGCGVAGGGLVAAVRWHLLLPAGIRASGHDPQRFAGAGLRGPSSLLPISPSGIGTEQAFLVYLLRDQASKAALLGFSVGMRITIMATNLVLGFGTLLIWFRSTDWRSHTARRR